MASGWGELKRRNVVKVAVADLPGGNESAPTPYTVALTCDTDDPMIDNDTVDDTVAGHVIFTPSWNASVIAGQTTRIDF